MEAWTVDALFLWYLPKTGKKEQTDVAIQQGQREEFLREIPAECFPGRLASMEQVLAETQIKGNTYKGYMEKRKGTVGVGMKQADNAGQGAGRAKKDRNGFPGAWGQKSQGSGGRAASSKSQGSGGRAASLRSQGSGGRAASLRSHGPEGRTASRQPDQKSGKSPCPVASRCGSCRWISKSYEEQLAMKAIQFRKLMEPFVKTEAIIGMEQPLYYRNKVHAVFGEDKRHNAISGTYEEKSHKIVPLDSCMIENQKADAIIVSIRGLLKSFKIRPYNEDTDFGLLRHVLIRVGHATGQIMVVLVLTSPILPSRNNFVKALLKLHPEITTIVVNVNSRSTSMVLGDKEQVIYGKGYIEDVLCGKTFRISPRSFYQVNQVQTEKLYEKAMEYAHLTGRETVLDAYCGTGTIGVIASDRAGQVIGVELNPDAVRDAVTNAKRNRVSNIQFYTNDAGKFLLEMAQQEAKLDVLFLDPPRSGSSEEFLKAALKIRPGRIVYISCNPETLVRDLKIMRKGGYRVQRSVGVDMFPFTDSLEAVCLLGK